MAFCIEVCFLQELLMLVPIRTELNSSPNGSTSTSIDSGPALGPVGSRPTGRASNWPAGWLLASNQPASWLRASNQPACRLLASYQPAIWSLANDQLLVACLQATNHPITYLQASSQPASWLLASNHQIFRCLQPSCRLVRLAGLDPASPPR